MTKLSSSRTVSRRQFLQTFLTITGGSILVGCNGAARPSPKLYPTLSPIIPASVQKIIARVVDMPRAPSPYASRDWRAATQKYDQIAFDFERKGDYLPLIWWDKTHTNMDRDGFGLFSYVGDTRQGSGADHEGINCIAAVLGASLVGIDKSSQNGHDWVDMLEDYYNSANGLILGFKQHQRGNRKVVLV